MTLLMQAVNMEIHYKRKYEGSYQMSNLMAFITVLQAF